MVSGKPGRIRRRIGLRETKEAVWHTVVVAVIVVVVVISVCVGDAIAAVVRLAEGVLGPPTLGRGCDV